MTDLTNRRPILCLDFDGVCHSYSSGWKGADVIPDAPVPGLFEALVSYTTDFEIHIYSSRSGQPGGIAAMKSWFARHYAWWHNLTCPEEEEREPSSVLNEVDGWLRFPTEKPPAFVGIDDRVITFTGRWPTVHALKTFQPWNKLDISGKPTTNESPWMADEELLCEYGGECESEDRRIPSDPPSRREEFYAELVRRLAERQELASQRQLFTAHTKAVSDFLNELYATMVDPLAEGTITVEEMKTALLEAARENRQALYDALQERDRWRRAAESSAEVGKEVAYFADHGHWREPAVFGGASTTQPPSTPSPSGRDPVPLSLGEEVEKKS